MDHSTITAERVRRHRLLFTATIIAITTYIIWRTFFTLPTKHGVVALLAGVLLLIAEIGAAFEAVVNYAMLSNYTPTELPVLPEDMYPDVDIFIATHNESVDLVYNTVNACTFLDYPDKSKVHVHLCDDNARPEMAKMAEELGVHYWGLPNNKDAKGGNLNNAIRQTRSPICVTLDADMIPMHHFLMKTVPYFFVPVMKKGADGRWIKKEPEEIDHNDKIGFVQTPQGFYNPDLFQYNLYSEGRYPGEQDMFFQEINVARSAYNATIYAGSNTLMSREALEDVDYIAVDTITEDILTGIRVQKLGYRCFATSEVMVQGQSPITIKSLISQRERWGRGCIDTFRQEPIVFSKRLSFPQKASYVASYQFWWNYCRRFIYLLAPIMTILFNLYVVDAENLQTLIIWGSYFLLFNRSLRVMSGDLSNQHWSAVADTVLFPYLIGPIIAEQFGLKQKKFVITDKNMIGNRARATFIFGLPHLIFLIMMLLSLVSLIGRSIASGSIYNPIIFFWLVIGIKNLTFALFFMWGRDNYRLASRFYFSAPVTIHSEHRTWSASTDDVSETGLAFSLDDPQYIPEDAPLTFCLEYRDQELVLKGKVVHIKPSGDRWKYSVHFDDMSPLDKRYYREFVYDRPHSLAKRISPSVSILDDFNLRFGKRIEPIQESMRKLPRVRLDIPFHSTDGSGGTLIDFNYSFASVEMVEPVPVGEGLTLEVTPAFRLLLRRESEQNPNLFRVLNVEAFITDTAIAPLLTQLRKKSPREKESLGANATYIHRAFTQEHAANL